MSQEFIQKITDGFQDGHHKISLHDRVVVFCVDSMRVEGLLIGFCPEGLLVACEQLDVWINSEAVNAVARARQEDRRGGEGREEFVSPGPAGRKKPVEEGDELMHKVFCNGTR